MSVCGRCGSIRAQQVTPTVVERVIAAVRGEQVIVCGRCGWRGRIRARDERHASHDSSNRRRRRRSGPPVEQVTMPPHAEVDFAALDRALDRDGEGGDS